VIPRATASSTDRRPTRPRERRQRAPEISRPHLPRRQRPEVGSASARRERSRPTCRRELGRELMGGSTSEREVRISSTSALSALGNVALRC